MTNDHTDRLLEEYDALRDPLGDPELEALKAAIFVEDAFGITLSDADIDADLLGSSERIRELVNRRRGEL